MTEPLLPVSDALGARLSGTPFLLMLDVDGTLAPIAARPEEARVPARTSQVIAALAAREGVSVALVSGRAASDARRMVRVANTWVIGNHGYETVSPEGETIVDPQVETVGPVMAQAARRLEPRLEAVPGVILENKRWTLSIHYRLADPAVVPRLRALVEETAESLALRMTEGKMVFELRPMARVDKGTAVLALAIRLGGLATGASVAFMGDDRTDEDAFRALRHRSKDAVTVRVANDPAAPTAAEFSVADPDEVLVFLEWLLEQRGVTLPGRAAGGGRGR